MDTNAIEECVQKLGYYGALPNSLFKNPSTASIWKQFVNNVKPRSEVEVCRKNIIINRLQENSVKQLTKFPIPEIEVYKKLKNVNNEIDRTKARIAEQQTKSKSLSKAIKSNYLIGESLKQKIEEKEMKICMLNLTMKNFENETEQVDNMLKSRGVVSISEEESVSNEAISKLLKNLMDKIDKQSIKPKILSKQKYSSELNLSNISSSRRTACSTLKKNRTMLRNRFTSCSNISSRKSLFGNKKQNQEKESVMEILNEISVLDQTAGLLPETCFDFGADDEFLTTIRSSALKNFETNNQSNKSLFDTDIFSKTFSQQKKRQNKYYKQIGTNVDINRDVDEIFKSASKRIIWDTLCSIKEDLLSDVRSKLENFNTIPCDHEITEDDEAELNFIFVKINLLSLKYRKRIKSLKQAIREKRSEIMNTFDEESDGLSELELKFENIKKEATVQIMNRGITNNSRELRQVYLKLSKTKDELMLEIENIKNYMDFHAEIMEQLKRSQKNTAMCIRKINHFLADPTWTDALVEIDYSAAAAAFIDFPLIYNRQLYFTNQDLFYREIIGNTIVDKTTSNDDLHMIITLLEHPQNPPERILSDIFRKKNKLQILLSLESPQFTFEEEKYTLEELKERENYIEQVCEKLNSQIASSKSRQVLNSTSRFNTIMQLWMEMPFRRYISRDRKVDGKTYAEYEEKFSYLKKKK